MDNNVSEPIFNAVNAYLESDDKLAFQINGPWGIGKTYYVKNVVIESIKNDYKVVYLSLYGIGNLDLLKKELLIEILNIIYPIIPMNFLKRHSQQYRRVKNIASEIYSKSELFFQAIELGYSFFQEDILKKIDG